MAVWRYLRQIFEHTFVLTREQCRISLMWRLEHIVTHVGYIHSQKFLTHIGFFTQFRMSSSFFCTIPLSTLESSILCRLIDLTYIMRKYMAFSWLYFDHWSSVLAHCERHIDFKSNVCVKCIEFRLRMKMTLSTTSRMHSKKHK